jgi:DNA-binding MarR family transcriptional regulator
MTTARSWRISVVILSLILLLQFLFLGTSLATPCRCSFYRSGENAESYLWLEAEVDSAEILPDGYVEYVIKVHNIDNQSVTYYPPSADTLGLPPGWTITFTPSNELNIIANNYDYLYVNISAPSTAQADTELIFELIGTTSNPECEIIPAELITHVTQIFDTRLTAANRLALDSPLDPKNFDINIINDGNGDDKVELELADIPTGLDLSQASQRFIIANGDTDSLTITLYPSSILTAGEYKLTVNLYRIGDSGKTLVSSQDLWVDVNYYPDLEISMGDIELSKYAPSCGEDITVNVTVHNVGDSDARNIKVDVFPVTKSGSRLSDFTTQEIEFLAMKSSTTLVLPWQPDKPAVNKIQVELDSEESIGELNEDNNMAELYVTILSDTTPRDLKDPNVGEYTAGQVFSFVVLTALICITIGMGGFIASTEYGKYALFKLILPFYTRVKKEDVLKHGLREEVYQYVEKHPGEHFRAILTKMGLTNGTLIHHLQTLERQEMIKSERDGPFKRFYPTGRQFTEDVLEINGIQKKILDAVTTTPGVTQKDLALRLHTSPPTINYHIKALRGVRLINIERDGKNTRCFPGHSTNGWVKGEVS